MFTCGPDPTDDPLVLRKDFQDQVVNPMELREKATRALGPRFDIRRFHTAVLDQGPLPLDLLERVVDEWIAAEQAKG